MPAYEPQPVHLQGIQTIGDANTAAGWCAEWAVQGICSLYYLADLDKHLQPAGPKDVLGHDARQVDIAHARWATTTAISAIDLCAAALGRLHCGIQADQWDLSVGRAVKRRDLIERHPAAREWLRAVTADEDYEAIEKLRHNLTHKIQPHMTERDRSGAKRSRTFVAVFDVKVARTPPNPTPEQRLGAWLAIEELILVSRDLAKTWVEAFLAMAADGLMTIPSEAAEV